MRRTLSTLAIMFTLSTMTAQNITLDKDVIDNSSEYALNLCHHLHQNPEVSFREFETAKRIAKELNSIGFEVTSDFGGNSVIGVMKNGEGPTVMIRTDMDALPIKEQTGLPFASTKSMENHKGKEVPVMHACGHDIHMSVFTGSLRALVAMKDQWHGTLLVVAQQAEEMGAGALSVIHEGLYQKFPVPDYALAYHINPFIESGKVAISSGPVFAGVKTMEITLKGIGGHGAYPEKCIDPIVMASNLVLDIQTVVSRETSALQPVVVTVGSIHGGTSHNIIPNEVKLQLTLRYYDEPTIGRVIASIKRKANAVTLAAGISDNNLPHFWVDDNEVPPVLNNENLSSKLQGFATSLLGKENVLQVDPVMVGEDFGNYGRTKEEVPICLMWLGATSKELMQKHEENGTEPPSLHSPSLLPDYPKTIETGIEVMVNNVLNICK